MAGYELSEGEKKEQTLRDKGADDATINEWRTQMYSDLTASAGEDTAKEYFGNRGPNLGPMRDFVQKNISENPPPPLPANADEHHYANGAIEAFKSGMQSGAYGLADRKKNPDLLVAESAPIYEHIIQGAGQLASDAPVGLAGYLATAGVVAAAGVTAPAWLLPAAGIGTAVYVRRYLADAYEKGNFQNVGEYASRMSSVLMGTASEMTAIGGAQVVGGVAAPLLAKTMLPPIVQTATKLAAEGAGMAFVSSGMEGHLPSRNEILTSAGFVMGFHGLTALPRVSRNMSDMFAKTGEHPNDLALKSEYDPKLQQQLLAPENQLKFDLMELPNEANGSMELTASAKTPLMGNEFLQKELGVEFLPKHISEELSLMKQEEMKLPVEIETSEIPATKETMDKALRGLDEQRNSFQKEKDALERKIKDLSQTAVDTSKDASRVKYLEMKIDKIDRRYDMYKSSVETGFNKGVDETTPITFGDAEEIKTNLRSEVARLRAKTSYLKNFGGDSEAVQLEKQAIEKKINHLELRHKYVADWQRKNSGKLKGREYEVVDRPSLQKDLFDPKYIEAIKETRQAQREKIQALKDRQAAGEELHPIDLEAIKNYEDKIANDELSWERIHLEDIGQSEFALAYDKAAYSRLEDYEWDKAEDDFGNQYGSSDLFGGGEEPPTTTESKVDPDAPKKVGDLLAAKIQKELNAKLPVLAKLKTLYNKFRENVFDDVIGGRRAFVKLFKDKTIPADVKNFYETMRVARSSSDMTKGFIFFGPIDFNTRKPTGTRGYMEIVKPFMDEGTHFELDKYRIGKRVLEADAKGINTGFSEADLADTKAFIEQNKKTYDGAASELTQWNNDILQYISDSGILSKESLANVLADNKSYVTFKRIWGGVKEGAGGVTNEKPIRAMTGVKMGDTSKILAPTHTELVRAQGLIRLAEQMRALRDIAEAAKYDPEGTIIKETTRGVHESDNFTLDELMDMVDEQQARIEMENNPTAENAKKLEESKMPWIDESGAMKILEDGKPRFFQLEKGLADAVNNMQDNFRVSGFFGKAMVSIGNTYKAGIVKTPMYMVRNLVKDMPETWIMSKYGYVPFSEHAIGNFLSLYRMDAKAKNYITQGGSAGSTISFFDKNGNYKYEGSQYGAPWNTIHSLASWFEKVNTALEHTPRLSEYELAIKAGETPQKATFAAKEIGADFSMRGADAHFKALRQMTPFNGATLTGMNKLFREFLEGGSQSYSPEERIRNNIKLAAKATALITLPTAALYLLNRNNPSYMTLSQHDKDTNFILPLSWWVPLDDTNKNNPDQYTYPDGRVVVNVGSNYVQKLPKPREIGVVFGTAVEHILNEFLIDHPEDHRTMLKVTLDQFSADFIPPGVELGLGVSSILMSKNGQGYDMGTWGPTIPDSLLKNRLPMDRVLPDTSSTAKALSSLLTRIPGLENEGRLAPPNIDWIMNKWTGGAAKIVNSVLDIPFKWGERPEGAALLTSPIFKSFVTRFPYANPDGLPQFRDEAQKIADEYGSIQSHLAAGDDAGAMEIENRYGPLLGKMTGYTTAINNLDQSIRGVFKDTTMLPYEKRQLTDSMLYELMSVVDDGKNYARENRKEINDAVKATKKYNEEHATELRIIK